MATRRQPLNLRGLLPGLFAATLLCAVALAAFLALWFSAPGAGWQSVFSDSYLWHVVRFSFWQAFLSALLSVVPAIFLARALYRRRFPGRLALLRLCAMTLILPVLVAVFGILSVYGRQGWLATLCQSLGLEWTFSPYGLQGILLAHVFFNLPMASRLLLQALENIPGEQRQLAAQLGMRGWQWMFAIEGAPAVLLGLIAEGLTNKEIATRLFVTVRTAEYHIHHALAKLKLASRQQLRVALADLSAPQPARP